MSIVWSSQVTHTAVVNTGGEVRSATYTTNAGSPSIYALGAVFAAPGGVVANAYAPESRVELGQFTDERVARLACEAFCEGKTPSEIAELVLQKTIELSLASPTKASPS